MSEEAGKARIRAGGVAATVILAALVIADRPGRLTEPAASVGGPTATASVSVCGIDRSLVSSSEATQRSITADPALCPEFDPQVSDYVTRCAGGTVEMTVVAPADTTVAIDGGPPRNGSFTKEVLLQAGQSFSFTRNTGTPSSTHHVRCLPADFPQWQFESFAAAEQGFYVVASGDYVFALDGNGVPLWWHTDNGVPSDAKHLDDGTFAWATGRATPNARYAIRGLDGSLRREMRTVGTPTDGHDMLLLPHGNYMMMTYRRRVGTVDLSAYGGLPDSTVLDAELQEVTPAGTKLWTWNSKDHIRLEETGHWFKDFVFAFSGPKGFDIVHINSVDVNADSVLIALRHTDGVYKIDRDSGAVIWKLGGTPTPESLTVVGDPAGGRPFVAQHDARMHADGTVTVFDNGVSRGRAPRAVRFRIDAAAKTATYLESISDPGVAEAVCCGSARRTASGGWLVGWGGGPAMNPIIEYAADGSPTFRLTITTGFSYRAHPIAVGQVGRAALRNGMDTQHPRVIGRED